jgi:hypothetical protein
MKSKNFQKSQNKAKIGQKGQMGCPALGIWVGFLKQPALPGEAPPQKNSSKKILKNKNH